MSILIYSMDTHVKWRTSVIVGGFRAPRGALSPPHAHCICERTRNQIGGVRGILLHFIPLSPLSASIPVSLANWCSLLTRCVDWQALLRWHLQ